MFLEKLNEVVSEITKHNTLNKMVSTTIYNYTVPLNPYLIGIFFLGLFVIIQ